MAQGFFLLLPLLHLAQASNYDNYNYEYYDQEQPEEVTIPRFITEPMTLVVNEGDVIRLPCKVDRSILNQFVLLWRKDSEIIAVDGIVIKDKRLCLEKESDGLALVLGQAELGDEGEYICQISTHVPTELRHHVKVRGLAGTTTSATTTAGLDPLLALLIFDCLYIVLSIATG